jgi:putative ATP-dependent endonuclease of the OLD family
MKLTSIRIEKFRAIRSCQIRVGSELALVGQNSAGKSSILRALNAFFNFEVEEQPFELGRHRFQKTSTAEIDLEFADVPAACTIPRLSPGTANVRVRLRYKRSAIWQVNTNGAWAKPPDTLHEEIRKFVRYVYVPLRRDHEVSAWGDSGLLQTAVEAWVRSYTKRRDSISPKVSKVAQMIQRRAFDGLSKQLRRVTPIDGKFAFKLEYTRPPDYTLLVRDLVLRVTEGATTVDLEDCGSGTQSMTAFALYSYLAELEGSTYILGIEEPEQNLHPQAQRKLLANLRDLPLQVLFTTHSTVMLDALGHEEVVLCRRIESTTRGVEVTTTQLEPAFWAQVGLDADRYYQFFRRRNLAAPPFA